MPPLASPRYCLCSPSSSQSSTRFATTRSLPYDPCPDHHHRHHYHNSTPPLLHVSNLADGRKSSFQSGLPSLALCLWPWEHSQKNRTSLWSLPVYSCSLDSPSPELSTFIFSQQPWPQPLQPSTDGVVVFLSLLLFLFICWSPLLIHRYANLWSSPSKYSSWLTRPLPGPCTLTRRCPYQYQTCTNMWSVHRCLSLYKN